MPKEKRGGKKSPSKQPKSTAEPRFSDTSKYSAQHNEIVDWVKKQTGVDLNKYRNGNGESPYTTSYWDKNGPKVAVDLKGMSTADRVALDNAAASYGGKRLLVEIGGAWIGYISLI